MVQITQPSCFIAVGKTIYDIKWAKRVLYCSCISAIRKISSLPTADLLIPSLSSVGDGSVKPSSQDTKVACPLVRKIAKFTRYRGLKMKRWWCRVAIEFWPFLTFLTLIRHLSWQMGFYQVSTICNPSSHWRLLDPKDPLLKRFWGLGTNLLPTCLNSQYYWYPFDFYS